jgi:hypothetical protein
MDIVLCIEKCWWKGWKGLFLLNDEPVFPTWYCLWMSTNGIIFFFLVKRGSKWTLLDQWSSWGIIVSTTLCIIKLNIEIKFWLESNESTSRASKIDIVYGLYICIMGRVVDVRKFCVAWQTTRSLLKDISH